MEKRKYQTQKQKYLELLKESCFCMGEKIWRPMCSECKIWFKEELGRRIILVKKKYSKEIKGCSWDGVEETIMDAQDQRGIKK